ncbi:MAG: ribosome maturation factor RimM [Gemmatimonadales bacterium]|nr:ribosome maturation factor RimM [Gemmatimonadales bacterium]
MDRFIAIGEVVKAVGLRGEVKLYPLLDFFEPLLDSGFLIWDDGAEVEVVGHRVNGNTVVLKVSGMTDRTAAEGLVGRSLGFDRDNYLQDDFPRPDGGLPFRYLGRLVETVSGEVVGVVEEVRFTVSNYLLVVAGEKMEILIPAVEPILLLNLGLSGNLVIDPPEGLLDVQSG